MSFRGLFGGATVETVVEGAEAVADGAAEGGKSGEAKAPRHPGRRSVGWALVRAARLHRARLGDRLAALGLFPGQETMLQALAAEGPLTVGELADLLRVRPPTASKAVSRLKALGLVERLADGRAARIGLTDEGRGRAEAVERLAREVERDLLGDFGGKERKRLRKLLRRAARNLVEAGTPETAEPAAEGA
jgi:DNA-binding MarR family transcriptional regulator